MSPREKVAIMVADALRKDGCEQVSHFAIMDKMWMPQGGERGLDIARWDVDMRVFRDGFELPIHIHSWSTLTQLSRQKEIKFVMHSHREYEVM